MRKCGMKNHRRVYHQQTTILHQDQGHISLDHYRYTGTFHTCSDNNKFLVLSCNACTCKYFIQNKGFFNTGTCILKDPWKEYWMRIKNDCLPNLCSFHCLIRYGTVVNVPVFDLGYYLFQSIWSSPGPSPLEKLLEMQKQQRTTDPHWA